jgi:myo-inositol 2-dehydrogenase/D-chiro-inositol 1-dehydrogenase
MERFLPAFEAEMDAFVDVVDVRRANPCPPEDAREAFVAALAAERSRRDGRPVATAEIG